jgi:hypothetical protein
MKEMRILSPTAILGYGFPLESFERGLARRPSFIGVDAGSTDPGPYYLGSGKPFVDRGAIKLDLAVLIRSAHKAGIPLVIGTAGGSGGRPHVKACLAIVAEIAAEHGLRLDIAVVHADVSKPLVAKALAAGRVKPLPFVPELTPERLARTTRVVAQMGSEPLLEPLRRGVDIVVAGRCYDPALFAAPALLAGFDPGPALHLGKILECAAIAADPGSGRDCVLGTLFHGGFKVETLNPIRRFTTASVAAHTMYEKSHPYLLPGPGGTLDLSRVLFRQVDDAAVEVTGSRFLPSPPTVKLEGALVAGYRTFSLAGVRDPIMIRQLDDVLAAVRSAVESTFGSEPYELRFRVYGHDGVMGPLEPRPRVTGHEVGLVIDVVAATQAMADTVCGFARSTTLHYGYPGRMATAGNLAFPFSPSDYRGGPVYEFSVYHVMEVDDPIAMFPARYMTIGAGRMAMTAAATGGAS